MIEYLKGVLGRMLQSHYGMMALCVLAIGGMYLLGGGVASEASLLSLLLPLALCFAMHGLMHRFMGHEGHDHRGEEAHQQPEPRTIPDSADRPLKLPSEGPHGREAKGFEH